MARTKQSARTSSGGRAPVKAALAKALRQQQPQFTNADKKLMKMTAMFEAQAEANLKGSALPPLPSTQPSPCPPLCLWW